MPRPRATSSAHRPTASCRSCRPATANAAASSCASPAGDYETFKERQPDASESSLLYLFFILILVVEQAMAVHLSYHSAKSGEQYARAASRPPRRRRRGGLSHGNGRACEIPIRDRDTQ